MRVGAMLVGLVASMSLTLALGLTISRAASGGAVPEEYSSIGGVQIGFTAVAGVSCVAVIVRTVIGMCRVEIAQWQLAGVSARRIAVLIWTMVLMCSVVGGAVGAAAGRLAWRPFGEFVRSSGLPDFPGLSEPLPIGALWGGPSCGVAASLVAAVLNLRTVMGVEPIEAVDLHPMSARSARPGLLKLFLLVIMVGSPATAYAYGGVRSARHGGRARHRKTLFELTFRAICIL